MESDESRISFFLVEPEDTISRWRSAGPTPNGSPLDLHEDDFPEFDQGGLFHGLEASRMQDEVPHLNGLTTALNQQLGSIDLANHSNSVVPHMMTFSPSLPHDEARGMIFQVEHPSKWEEPHGGSPNAGHRAVAIGTDEFVTPGGGTYCPAHENLFRIETSFQAIDQQPLSGFSEQSPIISTPVNSSCSENSHGWSPYPSPHHRGRSLSVSNNHHVGTRRRSLSDAYAVAENNLDNFTPSDLYHHHHYLDIPGSGELTSGGYMSYTGSGSSMELQSFQSGCDSSNSRTRPPPRGRYSHSLSPGHRHGQVQSDSPVSDTRDVRLESFSNTGSPIKQQVASDAVKRAAWRKRKNPDGKSFECKLCHEKLTTKQNLQYHTSAHLGIRDFACKNCNKRFTTPHVQKRHEKRCIDLPSASS